MNTKSKQPMKAQKLRKAEDTRDDLSAVLRTLGIVLPSLSVEPMAYGDENPDPLIDMGRCNLRTARKLLAVLRSQAGVSAVHPAPVNPASVNPAHGAETEAT